MQKHYHKQECEAWSWVVSRLCVLAGFAWKDIAAIFWEVH
jgi:hypothetical protein